MAGEENLIPFSERSKEEARENGRKGGINSGKARRRKADLRKAIQIMATTEITDKNGKQATGIDIAVQGIIANLANPNSRNWGKAMDTFIMLLGANLSDEQKDKLIAETELTQAKTELLTGNKEEIAIIQMDDSLKEMNNYFDDKKAIEYGEETNT